MKSPLRSRFEAFSAFRHTTFIFRCIIDIFNRVSHVSPAIHNYPKMGGRIATAATLALMDVAPIPTATTCTSVRDVYEERAICDETVIFKPKINRVQIAVMDERHRTVRNTVPCYENKLQRSGRAHLASCSVESVKNAVSFLSHHL